ncbi:hypothetical protein ABIC83_002855 [Roseateles asaccharophilus]|uniref:hypothetical protein n=1 Tax=Roseateles asaccharophilus TaxID=582607 RepID=UPI0038362D60
MNTYTAATKILRNAQIQAILLLAVLPLALASAAGQVRPESDLLANGLLLLAFGSMAMATRLEKVIFRAMKVRKHGQRRLALRFRRAHPWAVELVSLGARSAA